MKRHDQRQRPDGGEAGDQPVVRDDISERADAGEDDHGGDRDDAKGKGEFEPAEDDGDLVEEGSARRLFGRGAPRHVDRQHVRRDGLGDVQRDAAEEDGQEG